MTERRTRIIDSSKVRDRYQLPDFVHQSRNIKLLLGFLNQSFTMIFMNPILSFSTPSGLLNLRKGSSD